MKIGQYLGACPWGDLTPETMNSKGLGGRETALILLSEQWARLGTEEERIDVINFVPVSTPKQYEYEQGTVYYVPHQEIARYCYHFGLDVLVSWEEPKLFDFEPIRENVNLKIIEIQVSTLSTNEKLDELVDYYAVLSDWAGEYLRSENPFIDKTKIKVFPNGVDLTRYEWNTGSKFTKRPVEFFYSSSPDRGLFHLLCTWPKIREKFPDAKLHVAYGIEKWCKTVRWSHNMQSEIAIGIEEKIKQDGIIYHGKIGQRELSKIQEKCSALLYPCDTMSPTETGCITIIEAGASGCPAITTDCDCLGSEFGETAAMVKLPYDENEYIDLIESVMSDETLYNKYLLRGKQLAKSRSWDKIGEEWFKFFVQNS